MGQTVAMVLYCPAPDAMPTGRSSRDEAEHIQRLVTNRLYLSGGGWAHICLTRCHSSLALFRVLILTTLIA